MNNKKIRILSDTFLFFEFLILFIIFQLISCLFIYVSYSGHTVKGMENGMLILGIVCFISVLLTFIMVLPKFLTIIEFNNQGIILKKPFKTKTPLLNYSSYKYMYLACYRQGKQYGLSYWRPFLVLSQRWMPNKKLISINTVENSEKVIKIKLSKSMCKKLLYVFPKRQKDELKKIIRENLPNWVEDMGRWSVFEETGDGSVSPKTTD